MAKILSEIKDSALVYIASIADWTSIRMVYLLMSIVLFIGWVTSTWELIGFVIVMLNVGVWTKFCPSKWIFEKLGWKKCDL